MTQLENASSEAIAKRLLSGGVALVPTDTVYGLAASPHCPTAVSRIFELKGRPFTTEYYGVAAKRGNDDLVRRINYVLERYRSGGANSVA